MVSGGRQKNMHAARRVYPSRRPAGPCQQSANTNRTQNAPLVLRFEDKRTGVKSFLYITDSHTRAHMNRLVLTTMSPPHPTRSRSKQALPALPARPRRSKKPRPSPPPRRLLRRLRCCCYRSLQPPTGTRRWLSRSRPRLPRASRDAASSPTRVFSTAVARGRRRTRSAATASNRMGAPPLRLLLLLLLRRSPVPEQWGQLPAAARPGSPPAALRWGLPTTPGTPPLVFSLFGVGWRGAPKRLL